MTPPGCFSKPPLRAARREQPVPLQVALLTQTILAGQAVLPKPATPDRAPDELSDATLGAKQKLPRGPPVVRSNQFPLRSDMPGAELRS